MPETAAVAQVELGLEQLLVVVLVAGRHRRRRAGRGGLVLFGQALELGLQVLVLGRFVLVAEAALERRQSACE